MNIWNLENKEILLVGFVVVSAMIAFYHASTPLEQPITEITTTTVPSVIAADCGDLKLIVDTIIEASNYYRFGIQRPTVDDMKFMILEMTAENKADETRDFSGYRLELTASGESYIPMTFNKIEKITVGDNTFDYVCEELALAHISRFEIEPGQKMVGCKIFQTLKESDIESLTVYDLEGPKCKFYFPG